MYTLFRLTNDYAFKRVFEDKEVTALFLSDLLKMPVEMFGEITVENPIILGEGIDLKISILDISLTLKTGEKINIEMQVSRDRVLIQRLLTQAGKLLSLQVPKGKSEQTYNQMKKTIIVAILVESHFGENSAYHKMFQLYDVKNSLFMTDLLEFHFLELDRINNFDEKEPVYEWCKAFSLSHDEDEEGLKELSKKSKNIAKAVRKLEAISKSKAERDMYDSRERALIQARDNLILAQEEAKSEGIKQGIIEVAISLLDILDDEMIANKCKISLMEVQKIRKENSL